MTCRHVDRTSAEYLLRCMESPGSVFLLGAGTSARLFPNSAQQAQCVLKLSRRYGGSIAEDTSAETKARILGMEIRRNPELVWSVFGYPENALNLTADVAAEREVLISESAVRVVHLTCCVLAADRGHVPEYDVFHHLPPSVIATTNYDGLASRHCRRWGHEVILLHGYPPTRLTSTAFWRDFLRWQFEYGSGMTATERLMERTFGLQLPSPEKSDILANPEYIRLRDALLQCKRLVVIGYAFGGGDDAHTMALLTGILKDHPVPVVAVDVNSDSLDRIVSTFRQASRVPEAVGIVASWSALASSIERAKRSDSRGLSYYSEQVAHSYMKTWEEIEMQSSSRRKWQCEHCAVRKECFDE